MAVVRIIKKEEHKLASSSLVRRSGLFLPPPSPPPRPSPPSSPFQSLPTNQDGFCQIENRQLQMRRVGYGKRMYKRERERRKEKEGVMVVEREKGGRKRGREKRQFCCVLPKRVLAQYLLS